METSEGGLVPQVGVTSPSQAVDWISGGWDLFKKAPGIWIAILVVYFLVAIVLSFIPFIGSLALNLISPVLAYGIVHGARELHGGGELQVGHLFAGFSSPRLGDLIVLGLISLLLTVVLVAIIAAVIGVGIFLGGGGDFNPESFTDMGIGVFLLVLLSVFAGLLIAAAFMFAAPLIGFNGMKPVAAVMLSFSAALRNWLPLLVWGLLGMLLAVIGSIPFFLGLLVVMPVLMASYYLAYRDIFASGGGGAAGVAQG